MDRSTFETRLLMASHQAVEFARQYAREALLGEVVYRIYPNQSYDGHPRVGDEVIFPDDSLPDGLHPDGRYHGPWAAGQVVDFLWREEKVPEWIDINVQAEKDGQTEVALRCCGRFTAQDDLLYHPGLDTRPFAVQSPILPRHWVRVEVSGRFSLAWPQSGRALSAGRIPEKRRWGVSWFQWLSRFRPWRPGHDSPRY